MRLSFQHSFQTSNEIMRAKSQDLLVFIETKTCSRESHREWVEQFQHGASWKCAGFNVGNLCSSRFLLETLWIGYRLAARSSCMAWNSIYNVLGTARKVLEQWVFHLEVSVVMGVPPVIIHFYINFPLPSSYWGNYSHFWWNPHVSKRGVLAKPDTQTSSFGAHGIPGRHPLPRFWTPSMGQSVALGLHTGSGKWMFCHWGAGAVSWTGVIFLGLPKFDGLSWSSPVQRGKFWVSTSGKNHITLW